MNKAPIFILSCERSGSTLLQTLIAAHPHIAIPPESEIYPRFSGILGCYGDLSQQKHLHRLLKDLLRDVKIKAWGLGASVDVLASKIRAPTRREVFGALFERYASECGARRWGEKTTTNVFHLAEILDDYPEAQFIHIVRDGRDVVESLRRMGWGCITATALGLTWRRHLECVQNARSDLERSGLLEIRYEDLIARPRSVLERVFRFLGEPLVDTSMTYDGSDLRKRYTALHRAHTSLAGGIIKSRIGRYKTKLSHRDVELIECVAGQALDRYGYNREYAQPRGPEALEQWRHFVIEAMHWLRLRITHLAEPKTYGQHIVRNIYRRFRWWMAAHPDRTRLGTRMRSGT